MDTDGDGVYDTEAGTVAELTGIRIAENGIITGEDANGVIFNLGQIATANVANPSALYYDGNGYLTHPPLPWEERRRRYNRHLVPDWLVEKHMNQRH